MNSTWKVASCLAALLVPAVAFSQSADNYPSKPVNMITPFAPGAATDIEGRLYANELSKNLGQPFIMDFRPGGAMAVGMNYAARQKPDGYNLVWVTATYSLLPLISKDTSYEAYRDFGQVALMSKRSAMLAVSNSLPVKNIQEYIAYAKAHPGEINFATAGIGGIQHLTGLWLESATNTKVTFVHYKAIGASYPDVMSGRTQMIPMTFVEGYPMIRGGKMRAITIASLQRNPAVPDLPTASEQGVPGFEYSSWLGLITQANTPAPIVNKLHGELVKIIKLPEIREKIGDAAALLALGPAEFRQLSMTETERWKKLVADNHIKFDE